MASCSAPELPAYDAGWSTTFLRLADLALVVEGQELPVHSQVVARESQVLASLLEAQQADELGAEERTDGCTGGGDGDSAVSRLAAPLAGFSLPVVQLFLGLVYQPSTGPELLRQQPWGDLCGALRLADQLDAPRTALLLEGAAIAKLGDDCTQLEQWRPALQAADGLQQQAPRLYDRAVSLAASALLDSVPADAANPLLALHLFENDEHRELSTVTLSKLLGTFASGVRVAAATGCKWRAAARGLPTGWEYRGSYTTWRGLHASLPCSAVGLEA
ncbi:hypothetical protein ABPG75_001324 [Micractinium tetrahymenae]